MSETRIYIKGTTGFKGAVKTKLGGSWIHGDSDVNSDTIMFVLTNATELKAFKASIGESLITTYDLEFLTNPPDDDAEAPDLNVEPFYKMTFWTNVDSKIDVKKNQKRQRDNGPGIVL
jgi:hypothetical protein